MNLDRIGISDPRIAVVGGGPDAGPAVSRLTRELRAALSPGRPDDIVALAAASGPAAVALTLAGLATGTALFLVDRSVPAPWRDRLLARVAPSAALDTDAGGEPTGPWPALLAGRSRRDGPPVPDGTAYALATSGSTGEPKVVLIGRAALDHHVAAAAEAYRLDARDVVLQTAAPGFDVWFEETLPALAAGARLVLCPAGLRQTYDELDATVARFGVTVLNLPTGYWRGWLEHLERRGTRPPSTLRLVVTGSEAILADVVERWRYRFPDGPRLLGAYGLTETTVTATVFDPDRDRSGDGPYAPLGRPLPGTEVRVDGPVGELLVAGPRLMTGYLGDEPATAAAFTVIDGRRWLRTGDLVRVDADGVIRFEGRRDDQVKVGAERVGLGDVAAGLRALDGIRDAVVLRLADGRIGAVVSASGREPDDVRADLAGRVPAAFVPAVLQVRPALPRLASGKLDRQGLRAALEDAGPAVEAADQPTDDPVRFVGAQMADLLRRSVADDASFFGLGGNSLLAVELLSRLRERGLQLDLSGFFRSPTPRGVVAAAVPLTAPTPVSIGRVADGAAVPLTRQQLVPWLHRLAYPGSLAYNAQSVLVLHGQVDPAAVQDAVARMVSRHDALRLSVTELPDGRPVQRAARRAALPVEFVDLTGLGPAAHEAAGELHGRLLAHRFDPARPPLARWVLVRLAPREHRLYLIEDHLVHDGVSFALLIDELRTSLSGLEPPPPPPVTYLDYAAWQADQIHAGAYAERARALAAGLAGVPPIAALVARADPVRRAGTHISYLPDGLATACRAAAARLDVTLFVFLLSAYADALAEHFGQEDFAIGTAAANRLRPELRRTVGMFVNTVAIRRPVAPDPLRRLRELAARAAAGYDEQEVPFSLVVAAGQARRTAHTTPVYQVTFSFDDSPLPEVRLLDAVGEVVELQSGYAKVDLGLTVVPQREQRMVYGSGGGDARIKLIWQYRLAALDTPQLYRLAERFDRLLRAAVDAAMSPVC